MRRLPVIAAALCKSRVSWGGEGGVDRGRRAVIPAPRLPGPHSTPTTAIRLCAAKQRTHAMRQCRPPPAAPSQGGSSFRQGPTPAPSTTSAPCQTENLNLCRKLQVCGPRLDGILEGLQNSSHTNAHHQANRQRVDTNPRTHAHVAAR